MKLEAPKFKLIEKGWLPNMRRLILPDRGHTVLDMDLNRADLQVVIREAEDAELRYAVEHDLDVHLVNASDIFNLEIPVDECHEEHPNYPEHKARHKFKRLDARVGVHATNYGVWDKKLAQELHITVHAASMFRARWFSAHPGIKRWHNRTARQLALNRTITNAFGYRRVYFDRPDMLLSQALAWVPQSTVAIVIDHAMDAIATNLAKEVDILLQVHDSLVMQVLTPDVARLVPLIEQQSLIVVPYTDPLIIPVGFKTSTTTWGDVEPYKIVR